jgi:hypothetical protein
MERQQSEPVAVAVVLTTTLAQVEQAAVEQVRVIM